MQTLLGKRITLSLFNEEPHLLRNCTVKRAGVLVKENREVRLLDCHLPKGKRKAPTWKKKKKASRKGKERLNVKERRDLLERRGSQVHL